jgi:uncharacterized protein YcfL
MKETGYKFYHFDNLGMDKRVEITKNPINCRGKNRVNEIVTRDT